MRHRGCLEKSELLTHAWLLRQERIRVWFAGSCSQSSSTSLFSISPKGNSEFLSLKATSKSSCDHLDHHVMHDPLSQTPCLDTSRPMQLYLLSRYHSFPPFLPYCKIAMQDLRANGAAADHAHVAPNATKILTILPNPLSITTC